MKFQRAQVFVTVYVISLGAAWLGRVVADDLPPVPLVAETLPVDGPSEGTNEGTNDSALDDSGRELGIESATERPEGVETNSPSAGTSVSTGRTAAEPTAAAKPAKKPAKRSFPSPKTLPPTGPFKVLFFQNDFSYKADPDHDYVFGEEVKELPFAFGEDDLEISTGGELRHRFMNENNRLRPGPPVHVRYQLWRWRHYVDAKISNFRVYGELLEAESFDNDAPDLVIDMNAWDLQNLFFDWMFHEGDLGKHTFRYGREELLFGRQRLVSPLDWGNTRRNFQGYHYLLKGDDFSFDGFAVNPVNTAAGYGDIFFNDHGFDQPNYNVWFSGTYYTYTGWKDTVLDLYWLALNTNSQAFPRPQMHRNTFGTRWAHLAPVTDNAGQDVRVWDLEFEGGVQAGAELDKSVIAGFATGVIGHTWKKPRSTPRVSGLFYYGSGTVDRAGSNNTFNVFFPLGHAYWALSDNLSGQNLLDYCLQFDMKPTEKTAFTSAVHWFQLASGQDTAYNVATFPVGKPGNGRDLGSALDLYGYYYFNPNFDIQIGNSWFWYGEYIERTVPRGDATQFYVQTSLRY